MISAALEAAEERAMRVQERHDKLLNQICSYYVCHKELEQAIVGVRKAMDEEIEFAATLRKMQLWILATFPDHVDLAAALS
ncbi:50S ribosomal protein L20 [Bienertia sinuspersici]